MLYVEGSMSLKEIQYIKKIRNMRKIISSHSWFLLKEHLSDMVVGRQGSRGRIESSGWRRIPSVGKFQVDTKDQNAYLTDTGLERKLAPTYTIWLDRNQNSMNKYMKWRVKYMRKLLAKGRGGEFWQSAMKEMKTSKAFRLSAINFVLSGWYKNRKLQEVVDICYSVEKLIRDDINFIKYFRVFIPKEDPKVVLEWIKNNPGKEWTGKMRPLGVPTAPWRVVLHMWNNFLILFLETELKKFNHAYMPLVGTATCWSKFLEKVRDAKYIYEFDIKGFFNNVDIAKVIEKLMSKGMSMEIARKLDNILWSTPQNIEDSLRKNKKSDYDLDLLERKLNNELCEKMDKAKDEYHVDSELETYIGKLFDKLTKRYMKIKKDHERDTPYTYGRLGLPQGASPSTILSLLALEDWNKKLTEDGTNLLMYADDGLIYSDQEFIPSPPEGFEFAAEKCKWIKRKGFAEVESLKFLGLEYNFMTRMIKGRTRKGSILEFNSDQDKVFEKLKDLLPPYTDDPMGNLARSGIYGVSISKLYNGKFGTPPGEDHVEYKEGSYWDKYHSLEDLKNYKSLQRTASSIACGWLAIMHWGIMNEATDKEVAQLAKSWHESGIRNRVRVEFEIDLSDRAVRIAERDFFTIVKLDSEEGLDEEAMEAIHERHEGGNHLQEWFLNNESK